MKCDCVTHPATPSPYGGSAVAIVSCNQTPQIADVRLFQAPTWETRYETLKSTGAFESTSEDLDEKDSYVSVGDPVVQVIDGE